MTTFALLPVMLLAITAAWLAYALPGLLSYTGSIADACQSIFVRCVEIFSLGKLFIFWSGALLVLSGIVYASFRAAFDIVKTNRAIKRLPLSKRCAGFILINDDSLKAAFTHGLLKPAVYLSRGLLKSLSNEELKVVLLHELSHKKRKDPLRFLRNAFFYLPAIGRIVSFSRLRSEHAADDAAARTGGQVSLASAILKVARTALPVPSITGSQEQVSGRIRRLLEDKEHSFLVPRAQAILSFSIAIVLAASLAMPLYAGTEAHECTMEHCKMHVDQVNGCKTHCEKHGHIHDHSHQHPH